MQTTTVERRESACIRYQDEYTEVETNSRLKRKKKDQDHCTDGIRPDLHDLTSRYEDQGIYNAKFYQSHLFLFVAGD